ncbi:MAG: hypothetical protein AAGK32_13525, partial [Actinomycetota bacterium]
MGASVGPAALIVLLAVALGAFGGRPDLAVLLAVTATLAAQARALSARTARLLARVAGALGTVVASVLLFVVGVALLPVWLALRIARWSPLRRQAASGRWQVRALARRTAPTRTFAAERSPQPLVERLHGVAAVVVLLALLAVPLLLSRVGGLNGLRARGPDLTSSAAEALGVGEDPAEPIGELGGVPVYADSFPGEPHAADLFEAMSSAEAASAGLVPDAELGWRLLGDAAVGDLITITDGRRVTTATTDPDAVVWLFGGSTTFGTGQRDTHTIASQIVASAEEVGHAVEVVNFGVPAYVNWQETLLFVELLDQGGRPDAAVFFDGCNEMGLAFDRARLGLTDPSETRLLAVSDEQREQDQAEAAAR